MTTVNVKALTVAWATLDAYSFDNYGRNNWLLAAEMLLKRGYNEQESEAILRSKWTRWAADRASWRDDWKYGETTADDLARFMDDMNPKDLAREVVIFTRETFRHVLPGKL